jgi:hypothetical protein
LSVVDTRAGEGESLSLAHLTPISSTVDTRASEGEPLSPAHLTTARRANA